MNNTDATFYASQYGIKIEICSSNTSAKISAEDAAGVQAVIIELLQALKPEQFAELLKVIPAAEQSAAEEKAAEEKAAEEKTAPEKAAEEKAAEEKATAKNVVIASFGAFNERRYSTPWVAQLTPEGYDFSVGTYTGNGRRGEEGDLVVFAPVNGAIYAYGQKDYRSARGSNTKYARWDGQAFQACDKIGRPV